MIDPKDVVAILVTRGDVDLTEIRESLKCFKEVWIWDNSKAANLGVSGRYEFLFHIDQKTVVYTQDDDCVLEDPASICQYYESGVVTCNMPQDHRSKYADGSGISLVGFGAIFDSRCATDALTRFYERWPRSEDSTDRLIKRECDRVVTALNRTKLVDLPFHHLPHATAPDRMYRQPEHMQSLEEIRRRIREIKCIREPEIDILYCAWNRLEFTKRSFEALLNNTDPHGIGKIIVYHDGSTDGTAEWLHDQIWESWPHEILGKKFGSPVAITRDFLSRPGAPLFAKIDNDLVVCPGWLDEGLRLMKEHPEVSLLGIEPHISHDPVADLPHSIEYCSHIGGIGFMRREAFKLLGGPHTKGQRYGFTEWQWSTPSQLKAWIHPPLPVFLLDHLPFEPYRSLNREYVMKGWQRDSWGEYPPDAAKLWEWWLSQQADLEPTVL